MVESSKDNIAKMIKRLREQIGLLQEKLAPLVDVPNNTLINIERVKHDNPTIETPKKIAKALNMPVEDLIK